MMSTKHTPGPWSAGQFRDGGPFPGCDIGSPDGANVAQVLFVPPAVQVGGDIQKPEALANARLIAAAPDLLAALQYVLSAHGEQLHDAFDQARAAIAAAEGDR